MNEQRTQSQTPSSEKQLAAETSGDPTERDKAASAACTRSGAFILLLSVVLLLLVRYWKDEPHYAALRQYLVERLRLVIAVENIDSEPSWQRYKKKNKDAEMISLRELQNLRVRDIAARSQSVSGPKQKKKTDANADKKAPLRPNPPTILEIKVVDSAFDDVYESEQLTTVLQQLNSPDMLGSSRQVSNFFDYSIAHWVSKRDALIHRNINSGKCSSSAVPPTQPTITDELLLNCLTVEDVRELAKFEQPILNNTIELGGKVTSTIDIVPGSLPRDLFWGTIVAQGLLFFAFVYFFAFLKEATLSEAFPVSGTLFGAFSRSWGPAGVFFLALITPVIASAFILVYSGRNRWFQVSFCLLSVTIIPVFDELYDKSFFKTLNPFRTSAFVRLRNLVSRSRTATDKEPEDSPPSKNQ